MKRYFAHFVLLAALLLAPWLQLPVQAQTPAFTFAGVCGQPNGPVTDVVIAQTAQDAAGNSYVTGEFYYSATFGTVTLQSNSRSAFVAKLDAAGVVQWAVQVSGPSFGKGVTVDASGNVFLTGGFSGTAAFGNITLVSSASSLFPSGSNLFVAKLTSTGNFLWAIRAGSNTTVGAGIAVDASGCSYVCGGYSSRPGVDADFGPFLLTSMGYVDDVFVTKLDPTGRFLWVASGGSSGFDDARGIALDTTGNVYITGAVLGGLGASAQFGLIALTVFGEGDVLVAKLSPAGVWQWVRVAGGTVSDRGQRIAVDAQGMVHVVGDFISDQAAFGTIVLPHLGPPTVEVFVGMLSPAGVWQWVVPGGGPGDDYGYDLALDAAGNTYAVGSCSYRANFGSTVLTTPGDQDVFVCKIDPAGAYVWAVQAGGTGRDQATGVALSTAGALTLVGNTQSSLAIFGNYGFAGIPSHRTGFLARLAVGPLATAAAQRARVLTLWPNPARSGEVVHVAGLTTRQSIEVRDVLGRVVLTVPVLNPGTVEVVLPADLAAGIYFVSAGRQQVGRFTVQ